jgi:RNA polymerase sigma factor (sigma-70 family)
VCTDEQLLDNFLTRHDQAAFEALVRRHGPMVLGVCRRVLPNPHDVEDAFQATFLVLIHKARALSRRELLANWLYGVAYRTAVKAKGEAARRRLHERHAGAAALMASEPAPDLLEGELGQVLDEELQRLPKKYRVPLVLCYLEGQTYEQTARQLGWTPGTVSGRLARARDLLRGRLTRRGVTFAVGLLATGLATDRVTAAVPASLVHSTTNAAMLVAGGNAAATGAVSTSVLPLTKGVLQAMFWTKLKLATAMVLASGVLGTGVSALTYGTGAAGKPAVQSQAKPKPAAAPQQKPADDKEKIQGTWKVVSLQTEGKEEREIVARKVKLAKYIFTADKLITRIGDDDYESTYTLDPSKEPKEIDVVGVGAKKGMTLKAIYALDGDDLKIHAGVPTNNVRPERPKEFVTKEGSQTILLVFKRATGKEDEKPNPGLLTKLFEARDRMLSGSNLKQIGIALHNYHNDYDTLPAPAIYGKNGKPLLSWRVTLLPYIEQDNLYQQFNLDEPWDSEHNKKLLAKMPKTYVPPGVKTKEPYLTYYQVFVGPGTVFLRVRRSER